MNLLSNEDYEWVEQKVLELFEDYGVKEFPIDPDELIRKMDIVLKPYSEFGLAKYVKLSKGCPDGFNYFDRDICKHVICFNDFQDPRRIRQTKMHEIGHIYTGRNSDSDEDEAIAIYFAGYSLCPTPILIAFDLDNPLTIQKLFNISDQATEVAINKTDFRMCFGKSCFSSTERNIVNQFKNFMKGGV